MMRSALYALQRARGARVETEAGWELPASFPGEVAAAPVLLADESATAKWSIEGKDLPAVSVAPPEACLYRIRPGAALLLLPLARRAESAAVVGKFTAGGCAHALDVSSCYASLVLAGPKAEAVLEKASRLDVRKVPVGGVAPTGLAGSPVILGRHAAGWRILVGRDEAEDAWTQLEHAGEEFGLAVVGWKAAKGLLWPS